MKDHNHPNSIPSPPAAPSRPPHARSRHRRLVPTPLNLRLRLVPPQQARHQLAPGGAHEEVHVPVLGEAEVVVAPEPRGAPGVPPVVHHNLVPDGVDALHGGLGLWGAVGGWVGGIEWTSKTDGRMDDNDQALLL